MAEKLTKARRRYLERAVMRLDNPSKRSGTWEHIRSGRSGPALRWLRDQGFIRLSVMDERTDGYLTWFEIEATPAARAALTAKEDTDHG